MACTAIDRFEVSANAVVFASPNDESIALVCNCVLARQVTRVFITFSRLESFKSYTLINRHETTLD
jgi:hypothetical protein